MATKADKDDSVLRGRRAKRWHKFMAWSVNFINSWLEAGKMVPLADGTITKFDTIDVTPAEQMTVLTLSRCGAHLQAQKVQKSTRKLFKSTMIGLMMVKTFPIANGKRCPTG